MLDRAFFLGGIIGLVACALLFIPSRAFAKRVNDKLSIGGVLAGAYQYQDLIEAAGAEPGQRAS